jgi:uncharacterized membrane protein
VEKQRVEAFSDGMFAIIMTIMALNLREVGSTAIQASPRPAAVPASPLHA